MKWDIMFEGDFFFSKSFYKLRKAQLRRACLESCVLPIKIKIN